MIEVIFLIILMGMGTILARLIISKKNALDKRKRSLKIKHDLHYNSLDPTSPYAEKECCGNDCGCHTEKKQVNMKSSGDM